MARPLRYEAAGAVYHVMARGDGGKNVFDDDKDRFGWTDLEVADVLWCRGRCIYPQAAPSPAEVRFTPGTPHFIFPIQSHGAMRSPP
jgi:hypothetical protein